MFTTKLRQIGAALLTVALFATPATVLATDMTKTAGSVTDMATKAASAVEQLQNSGPQ